MKSCLEFFIASRCSESEYQLHFFYRFFFKIFHKTLVCITYNEPGTKWSYKVIVHVYFYYAILFHMFESIVLLSNIKLNHCWFHLTDSWNTWNSSITWGVHSKQLFGWSSWNNCSHPKAGKAPPEYRYYYECSSWIPISSPEIVGSIVSTARW